MAYPFKGETPEWYRPRRKRRPESREGEGTGKPGRGKAVFYRAEHKPGDLLAEGLAQGVLPFGRQPGSFDSVCRVCGGVIQYDERQEKHMCFDCGRVYGLWD